MKRLSVMFAVVAVVASTVRSQEPQPAEAPVTIVHAGALLAVPGEDPKPHQSVVVRNGRVEAVHDGFVTADEIGLTGEVEVIEETPASVTRSRSPTI